jgi:acetoin utilization protein AcuB
VKTKPIAAFMTKTAYQVGHDQSVVDAHLRMQELGVRHLPVMKGSRLVGIVSQRDLATLVAISEEHPSTLQVGHAMTQSPYVARSSTPISEVARAMAEHKYGAVVVVDDDEVKGIFTTTDAMRLLAEVLG